MSKNKPNDTTALTDPSVTNAINAELYTTRLKSQVYDLMAEIEQLQKEAQTLLAPYNEEIQTRHKKIQQLNVEIAKVK